MADIATSPLVQLSTTMAVSSVALGRHIPASNTPELWIGLCASILPPERTPTETNPQTVGSQGAALEALIMARILETLAKSLSSSVSFQVCGQSVCHVWSP